MKISAKGKTIAALAVAVAAGLGIRQFLAGPQLPKGFAQGNGRIEATSVDIVPKVTARIAEVLAKEGDMVKKGDLLAKLDTKELDAQLRQARAQVLQAKQEKNYAKAVVAQRRSELALNQKTLARAKSLYTNESISLNQLQESETAVETAKATLSAAETQVVKADASILAASAQADAIAATVEESELFSPIDGRVLYRTVEPGEVVAGGSPIMTVLDLTDVYMTIFLPTGRAGLVAIGAEARILLDAAPDWPVPAKVSFVEPRAQFTPKQVETQSEREKLMFKVKVNVDREVLRRHAEQVKTGLPGVAFVRIDPDATWPPRLVPPPAAPPASAQPKPK